MSLFPGRGFDIVNNLRCFKDAFGWMSSPSRADSVEQRNRLVKVKVRIDGRDGSESLSIDGFFVLDAVSPLVSDHIRAIPSKDQTGAACTRAFLVCGAVTI